MAKIFSLVFILSLLIYPSGALGGEGLILLTPVIRQGQTVIITLDSKPETLNFDGRPVALFPYGNGYRAVIPTTRTIALGSHTVKAVFAGGTVEKSVIITPAFTKTIVLPVPPKLNQTPKQVVQNLASSNTATKKVVDVVSTVTRFKEPFGLPLYDNRKISSPFGEVRQTGDEKITHYGTDFVMPKGSAVAAINAGVIASSYLDPIYGNTVIVDHGQGIYSVYMHLDSMKVKKGDVIKKGQLIGRLGETGLASAPHLHLSIKINGQSVDPIQFVNNFR